MTQKDEKRVLKNENKLNTISRKIAIFQKMENCNFPRVFSFFLFLNHFSSFLLPVVQNFSKNGKLQCSSSFSFFFIIFSCFIIFSFLLPVVELMKTDKKKMIKNENH